MMKKQYFNIKYPFTKDNFNNIFIDLNDSELNSVRSKIFHLLFTPKGQRYRLPDFGTNLISFIFNPNDSVTWEAVNSEIKTAISKYVPNATIRNIEILSDNESVAVEVEYGIKRGNAIQINTETIQLT